MVIKTLWTLRALSLKVGEGWTVGEGQGLLIGWAMWECLSSEVLPKFPPEDESRFNILCADVVSGCKAVLSTVFVSYLHNC